jgi:hypothetical protein
MVDIDGDHAEDENHDRKEASHEAG